MKINITKTTKKQKVIFTITLESKFPMTAGDIRDYMRGDIWLNDITYLFALTESIHVGYGHYWTQQKFFSELRCIIDTVFRMAVEWRYKKPNSYILEFTAEDKKEGVFINLKD